MRRQLRADLRLMRAPRLATNVAPLIERCLPIYHAAPPPRSHEATALHAPRVAAPLFMSRR